jgi:hypothetical protein
LPQAGWWAWQFLQAWTTTSCGLPA